MAYYANEAYNKQTSNEGFWQSAGVGIGVGAATAVGIAGSAHGASYGMMKYGQRQRNRAQERVAGQMSNAFKGLDQQTAARNIDFYDGPNGTIPMSADVKARAAKEHALSAKAIQDGTEAQMRSVESKFENSRSKRFHGKAFGGGFKKTAGVYGGSALMGAITGGSIDYLNN